KDNMPALEIQIKNAGTGICPEYSLHLYQYLGEGQRERLLREETLAPIQPQETLLHYVQLPIFSGNIVLKLFLNRNHTISESNYSNNDKTIYKTFNLFQLSDSRNTLTSLDGKMQCEIEGSVFPTGTVAYVDTYMDLQAVNQADLQPVPVQAGAVHSAFEIGVLNENLLADSTGLLPGGATMKVSIEYDTADSTLQQVLADEALQIYRWEEDYQKWLLQSSQISVQKNQIIAQVSKMGTYSIFGNYDTISPQVDANVEKQEFTYGGYISESGTISFIFNDANGIDIFDHGINLFLDGEKIPNSELTISAVVGHLTTVPVKYRLNLKKGSYVLLMSFADVNGNYREHSIPFFVNDTFDIINVGNYPNPVYGITLEPINEGRTRFTYVLTDDADEVSIKIFTVSGRKVKTFHNLPSSVGYHEYPRTLLGWDCRDTHGEYLSNGTYFYKIVARKGSKKIEKIQKMAILK
ncbi:MAG: hypothetical protein K8S56_08480, partial [Candidatus Cloacimonetes bacterium]|nr:hypothetical protein [Candidatus Cloacimonadota bacterium]